MRPHLLMTFVAAMACSNQIPTACEEAGVRVLELCWDDLGWDRLAEPALTPNWHAFTARPDCARFLRFWAAPSCSPARAMRLTGRYPLHQTVPIGTILHPDDDPPVSVEPSEAMPWQLPGSRHHFGKWHVGAEGYFAHPTDCGYTVFRGSQFNLNRGGGDYFRWRESWSDIVSSGEDWRNEYAPARTMRLALDSIEQGVEYVSAWFHLIHIPVHEPPAALWDPGITGPTDTDEGKLRAMTMAGDALMGLLVERALELGYVVIWWSDNGGSKADGGKGTLYERSLNTPLAIAGPGVVGGDRDDLVSVCDLYSTVCELRGSQATTPDSVSLVPTLGGAAHARAFLYSEKFFGNGQDPHGQGKWQRAIRDARWKLIQSPNKSPVVEEFFDLLADPGETTNLLDSPLTGEAQAAYDALVALWP